MDRQLNYLLVESTLARLLVISGIMVVVYAAIRNSAGVHGGKTDTSLPPVTEVNVIVDTPVRRNIVEGKIRLGKEDFGPLYELVDSILKRSLGVGLSDPDVVHKLAHVTGLDEEYISRYVGRMNKLLSKLREKKFFPVVVFWGRTIRKIIYDSNELLSRLGAGLYGDKKIEELLRKT